MATPRSRTVDEAVTPWYHCISRCVRRAFLCGGGFTHRKQWIEDRLRFLVGIFSIDCAGFAVLDNHLHILLRLDSPRAQNWSNEEVARRWLTLFPLRDEAGNAFPVSETRVAELAADTDWVAKIRSRLVDLGWFMKCLKEPLAKQANKEEGCSGAFWEGRFRSVAVLDEESLLATAAYIDLNPLAAGVAATPEDSTHTSLRARLDHARDNGSLETVRDDLSTQTSNPSQDQQLWLLPTDDRRSAGDSRAGLVEGCTLSCYLRLVDWTSRVLRAGKAHLDASVQSLFERLRIDADWWQTTMSHLVQRTKAAGTYFGARPQLAAAAAAHGRRWHRNAW